MVEGAKCPECGKPVSNTSIRANAPVCTACGVTLIIIDGKLGFIGPYRVLDRGTSRKLAEANLAVFHKQLRSYRGMQGDCKQKLEWSVEQYAEFHMMLPQQPALLVLEATDTSFGQWCFSLLAIYLLIKFLSLFFSVRDAPTGLTYFIGVVSGRITDPNYFSFWSGHFVPFCVVSFVFCALVFTASFAPYCYFRVVVANGKKPQENARRKSDYEKDMADAFRRAKSAKEITDFQLGDQIRELEGYIRTAEKNEVEVRQYLATLR